MQFYSLACTLLEEEVQSGDQLQITRLILLIPLLSYLIKNKDLFMPMSKEKKIILNLCAMHCFLLLIGNLVFFFWSFPVPLATSFLWIRMGLDWCLVPRTAGRLQMLTQECIILS